MGIESDLIPEVELFTCPFIVQCDLPKHHFLCKVPECKTCSEYISRSNKLKQHRVLY